MKNLTFSLLTLALFLSAQSAFSYYSVLETGNLVAPGQYRATVSPQFIISGDDGANISGKFDFGINEEMSGRAQLGFGEIDVFLGGSVKWIPIPDYSNQPAFGVIAGATYANNSDIDFVTLRLAPLISKKFNTEFGELTPYASLPVGIAFYKSTTDVPINLTLGTESRFTNLDFVKFLFELGMKLNNDSFSYISLAAAWEF